MTESTVSLEQTTRSSGLNRPERTCIAAETSTIRDPQSRLRYARAAMASIPRLLGAMDRNPYRETYGCLDRQFWHYRTAAFSSEMYQEGVLPLAQVHAWRLPGNRWYNDCRVRELAIAGMRFSARSCHRDGSCDDYYPFERALGAAVFSLAAAAEAYHLLNLNDADLVAWFHLRARWLMAHDESGRLANHQALAALALARVARITGDDTYDRAAQTRARRVVSWQSDEGWFDEYGGADPGYQTVTIDALAKYRRLTGAEWLDRPLERAINFARLFLHPDNSFAGEYGSRGTYHFYPHGFELLARESPAAADLADGFLAGLCDGSGASMDDDRMFAHRLGNLIEAYRDWSSLRPLSIELEPTSQTRYFSGARLLVRRAAAIHTVVSAARGGVFKHFCSSAAPVTDAGLIIELSDGRTAVSQTHDCSRSVEISPHQLTVSGPLDYVRFETASPVKQALFHVAMALGGRFCRSVVRRLLQRRLITGRRPAGIRLTRTLEFLASEQPAVGRTPSLRVTDRIEIRAPRLVIRRMSFGTDHQTAYVAASGVYHPSAGRPWTELSHLVDELNRERQVTIVRQL